MASCPVSAFYWFGVRFQSFDFSDFELMNFRCKLFGFHPLERYMHKILIFSFTFLGCLSAFCQKSKIRNASNQRHKTLITKHYDYQLPISSRQIDSFLEVHNVYGIQVRNEYLDRKGHVKKSGYWTQYIFDAYRNIDSMYGGKNTKPKSYVCDYQFSGDSSTTLVYTDLKKNKTEKKVEMYFPSTPRKQLKYTINHKGDTSVLIRKSEIDSGNLKAVDEYFEKGKLVYQWTNHYYPDYQLKQVVFTNNKGKTLYIWDYQCAPEGKEITKQKDTSRICQMRETDSSGTWTIQQHTVDENGNLMKEVYQYTEDGHLLLWKRSAGENDELRYMYTATFRNGKRLRSHSVSFYRGDTSYAVQTLYDQNGMELVKTSYDYRRKKKPKEYAQKYVYDQEGKPLRKEEYVNNRLTHRSLYLYNGIPD
jgi:hypothetical protein